MQQRYSKLCSTERKDRMCQTVKRSVEANMTEFTQCMRWSLYAVQTDRFGGVMATCWDMAFFQVNDVASLRDENKRLMIIAQQLEPYIRSITALMERISPKLQVSPLIPCLPLLVVFAESKWRPSDCRCRCLWDRWMSAPESASHAGCPKFPCSLEILTYWKTKTKLLRWYIFLYFTKYELCHELIWLVSGIITPK